MTYFRLRVTNLPIELENQAVELAFSFGATGTSEALLYRQPDLTYDPDLIRVKTRDIDFYFTDKPEANLWTQLQTLHSGLALEIFEEAEQDWLAEWKKGFEPFELVKPFWIVPSWRKSPASDEHTLWIDPGMAFGTGTHATTKMASHFVVKVSQKLADRPLMNFLDVGTGTGVLAMLAQRLGYGSVTGLEIDPEARRVARENLAHNKMQDVLILDTPLEEVEKQYDVIVANIIDGVLIRLKDSLLDRLAPEGHLFLTGILLEREDIFLSNFIEAANLQIVRRLEQDEWVGFWLQQKQDLLP